MASASGGEDLIGIVCEEVIYASQALHLFRQDLMNDLQREVVEVLHDQLVAVKTAVLENSQKQEEMIEQSRRSLEETISQEQQGLRVFVSRELRNHSQRLSGDIARECASIKRSLRQPHAFGGVTADQASVANMNEAPYQAQWGPLSRFPTRAKALKVDTSHSLCSLFQPIGNGHLAAADRYLYHGDGTGFHTQGFCVSNTSSLVEENMSPCTSPGSSPRERVTRTRQYMQTETAARDVSGTASADPLGYKPSSEPSARLKEGFFDAVEPIDITLPGMKQSKAVCDRIGLVNLGEPPDTWLARFVCSSGFSVGSILIIFSNAVWMGIEVEALMQGTLAQTDQPAWFGFVNKFYIGLFTVELILRIVGLRFSFVFGVDWRWNMLDFGLVLFGVLSTLVEAAANQNVSMVRILRICRVCRALKIVRVLRFFRELQIMLCSIAASLASLAWSFGLLFIIIYIFSIFFMHGVLSEVEDMRLKDSKEAEEWMAGFTLYFSSLAQTMFSLLMAISGGADWGDICSPLTEASRLYQIAFVLYIVFIVFGVLNVLVGLFVSAAAENIDKDLLTQIEVEDRKKFMKQMHELFDKFTDTETITWTKFQQSLANPSLQAYMETNHLHFSDAHTLFSLLDKDKNGSISLAEFINGCQHLRGTARCSDMAFIIELVHAQQSELKQFRKRTLLHLKSIEKLLGFEP